MKLLAVDGRARHEWMRPTTFRNRFGIPVFNNGDAHIPLPKRLALRDHIGRALRLGLREERRLPVRIAWLNVCPRALPAAAQANKVRFGWAQQK